MFDKLCLILAIVAFSQASPTLRQEPSGTDLMLENEDGKLTVPEIIAKYGYPVEIHEVTTADGYILQVHRIPYGKTPGSGPGTDKPVIWLQHGILGDSSNWIMNTQEKALAFILANAGYDVWMGNCRGNKYSRKHVALTTDDGEFWNFSWHEMGLYDIPAVINYVLGNTRAEKIFYTGHSMGTTMFWVAMSEHPELNSKIRLMSAFAPVSFTQNMISPLAYLAPMADFLEEILKFLGAHELLAHSPIMDFLGATLCRENGGTQAICSNLLFLIAGPSSEQFNKTMLPIIMGHSPAGTSTRTVVHFAQGINSGLFRKFNHGKTKNREIYGQDTPPNYDFSKITCPVALYWSQNDWIGSPPDVYRLAEQLPNLVKKHRIPFNKYNHLDFVFAIDNNNLINNNFMDFLKYF